MYDGGSVMFGCTGHSIIVWDMGVFSQKGALRLMGGTNGVYDVNGDYLLANTPQSKIGVWKRGASSLTWGYNGMRRFMNKDESDGCRIATAIKVAKTAPKAYVGDMMGGLSLCDFRDRYIDQPSLTLKGAVKGIETFREWGLAVGTDEGELSLFDLRFLKKNAEKSVVQRLELPADEKSIGMIRACPQNPDMFACSAGRYVCIYDVSANKNGTSPWFVHDVHQSPVVDFDWSPCDMYQYTISSLEAASGHSPGKLHTWRPNTMALSGT
ncbi:hypothetical protein FBU59_002722 [Linderina macrospora]|uniref:Uncharacterized protein n=1 Tax=Linderina macrospora TaxID=4868 RepID=A0ACC1JA91_9FUNG|nr:hypothetical protein FBU59_002722 [Linderina macrospora]